MKKADFWEHAGLKLKRKSGSATGTIKKLKMPEQSEDALQEQVSNFLRAALIGVFWHNANENKLLGLIPKTHRENLLKKMGRLGMKPGVLDITIHWFAEEYKHPRSLYIELKSKTGTVKDNQLAMISSLVALGIPCAVCRSLEEVQAVLKKYNVPLRGKLS